MSHKQKPISEPSVVHLTDRQCTGIYCLLKLSQSLWWSLIVCSTVTLGSTYLINMYVLQTCRRKNFLIIGLARTYLIGVDVIQMTDAIFQLACKSIEDFRSRTLPWILVIINLIGCFPVFVFYSYRDGCEVSTITILFASVRLVKIISFGYVVLTDYRLNASRVALIGSILYVFSLFVISWAYRILATRNKNFLKLQFYHYSDSELYGFLSYFIVISITFGPIEKYVHYVFGSRHIFTLVFVIVVGVWIIWFLVALESVPANFMVNKWRDTYMASIRSSSLSLGSKGERSSYRDLKTFDRGVRVDRLVDEIKSDLKESIYQDMCLQYYYVALIHCDLFRNMDMGFLRALALRCVTREFKEGEIIIDKGDLRDSMLYVEDGTVGIADLDESDEPIFFLDRGSLIGEASLVRVYLSSSIVKCVSISCRIQILSRNSYLDLYEMYPCQCEKVSKAVNQRFVTAHKFVFYVRYVMIGHPEEVLWKVPDVRLLWIQNCMSYMRRARMHTPADEEPEYDWNPVKWNSAFHNLMPENLGRLPLYLAKLVPVPVTSIFKKRSNPIAKDSIVPLLYNKSWLIDKWENVFVISSIFFLVLWPFRLIFGRTSPLSNFETFFQFIFTADFVLYLCTAEKNYQGVLLTTYRELLSFKLFRTVLWIRCICAIPLDILMWDITVESPAVKVHLGLFQLPQLVCIFRVMTAIKKLKLRYVENIFLFQVILNIVILIYFSLVCGLFMLLATCWHHTCDKSGWYYIDTGKTTIDSQLYVITRSFILGLGVVLDIYRSKDYQFVTDKLQNDIYVYTFYITGFIMRTYLYNTTLFSLITKQTDAYRKNGIVMRLNYYLYSHRVKWSTKRRVEEFMEFKWKFLTSTGKLDSNSNESITLECFRVIATQPIFRWMSKRDINDLLKRTRLSYYPPNEVIIYKGQMMTDLHIVLKGICTEIPKSNKDGNVKKRGYLIGLPEMLLEKPSYQTIASVSSTIILTLPFQSFYESLKSYPSLLKSFSIDREKRFSVIKSLSTLQTSDLEYKFELYLLRPPIPNFITIHVPPQESPLAKEYFSPFQTSSHGDLYSFFLLNLVVNPNGKFYLIWECALAILFGIFSFLIPLKNILKYNFRSFYNVFFPAVFGLSVVDIYMKFHLAYYNEKGFLVKHPVQTAKNYMRNGFAMDFFTTLPFMYYSNIQFMDLIHSLKILRVYMFLRSIESRVGHRLSSITFIKYCLLLGIVANAMAVNSMAEYCYTGDPPFSAQRITCFTRTGVDYFKQEVPVIYALMDVTYIFHVQLQHLHVVEPSLDWLRFPGWLQKALLTSFVIFSLILYKSIVAADQFNDDKIIYQYELELKKLNRFLGLYDVPKALVERCDYYFSSFWKSQLSTELDLLFEQFDDSPLGVDILFDIYGETFRRSLIPNAASSFYKNLLKGCKTFFLPKGTVFYRMNDIVQSVFVVNSGFAYCYDDEKRVSKILTRGDMFGSLEGLSKSSHTVVPQSRMEIIVIDCRHFHRVLNHYSILKKRFENDLHRKQSAPEISEKLKAEMDAINQRKKMKTENRRINQIEMLRMILTLAIYILTNIIIALHEYDFTINAVTYILEMVRFILMFQYYSIWEKKGPRHLSQRIDYTRIRRHLWDFIVEVVATFPMDLIYYLFMNDQKNPTFFLLKINRILELKVLYDYMKRHAYRLGKPVIIVKCIYDLCVCFMLSLFYISILSFVNIGSRTNFSSGNEWRIDLEERIAIYLNQLFNIITIICQFDVWLVEQKMHHEKYIFSFIPQSTIALITGIMMIISLFLSHLLFVLLSREFYKFTDLVLFKFFAYNRVVDRAMVWIKQTDSSLLRDYLRNHFDYTWFDLGGEDFPRLLAEAPPHIKGPVLDFLYRDILVVTETFRGFADDVLRQICSHIEYNTYMAGDIVVRSEEVNRTLYVVMNGRVQAVEAGYVRNRDDTKTYVERVRCLLAAGDVFGTKQGLVSVPFKFTYRCATVSTVLSLTYDKWKYLLDYFPLEKQLLQERIRSYATEDDEKI